MAKADFVNSAFRALITGATAKPSTNPVRAARAEFVATLAGNPPRPIPVDTDAVDLEERVDHLKQLLNALSAYLTAILDDTAQNVLGRLDRRQVDALLDFTSYVAGSAPHATVSRERRVA
jgi:hypothetical protein